MLYIFFFLVACIVCDCAADEKLQEITFAIRQNVHLEDAAIGIRPEEHDPYYDILRKLVELPVGELERNARTFLGNRFKKDFSKGIPSQLPVYADMHFHMQEYHGEPLIMRGHTQRIIPVDVDPPVSGLTRIYEIWLYTDDSQHNPTVVIAPGLPEKFKTGDTIQNHLKVTGVLFKKYIYKAQDQVRFAPLVLAGELSYDPPTYKSLSKSPVTILIISIFLLLFIFIVCLIFYSMKKRVKLEAGISGLPEKLEDFAINEESSQKHLSS